VTMMMCDECGTVMPYWAVDERKRPGGKTVLMCVDNQACQARSTSAVDQATIGYARELVQSMRTSDTTAWMVERMRHLDDVLSMIETKTTAVQTVATMSFAMKHLNMLTERVKALEELAHRERGTAAADSERTLLRSVPMRRPRR